ncbi:efflux RND transporter permease subunit [Paludibaculum fermentans]|uniref:Efflux RND transporter permease subunit n=1 Tax=Paludibaculum fermentans TaxID=1473598 RepID=A0A7S7SLP1_PALFE|nr:efflux RND transporter permease subunit [Paludibaculum fermentans]QOY89559.1 efflux RND transporter permease subunit [Paludibaculum fermentans]
MWIVRLALDRPHTFVVVAILILLLGGFSVAKMPTDIFPVIDIPVVSIIWTYQGLPTPEMEKRVTTFSEFVLALVNDVKSIESQTLNGVSVIKIYFHPQVHIDAAMAQVSTAVQGIRFRMPPGINPPWILRFGADTVPVIQLSLSSKTLSEAALYDYGIFRVRQQLSTVPGTLLPAPYGGKPRQIMVDIDQNRLLSKGLTSIDVSNAINTQNLMLPSGTQKIGNRDYTVSLNGNPTSALELNDVPLKYVNGATVYMRDVANVRDGYAVQTNVVRSNGEPAALLSIMKTGAVSTLDIVDEVKNRVLPASRAAAPKGLKINELFDQSFFVRASIQGVLKEGLIAACLTAAMILLFLGSWRSTLIITISIPLSILSSIIILSAMGHTLNIMTLGGLALAIGILVDDATVEIENTHRNLAMGKPLRQAVLDGAAQIAVPTFVSTLTICIVFVSVLFLTGPAKYLFTPMALAVVFAMASSYFLSRTLVPLMVNFLLAKEDHSTLHEGPIGRAHQRFNRIYEVWRVRYEAALQWVLARRRTAFYAMGGAVALAVVLIPFVGRDFFPSIDAAQIRMHIRGPAGLRVEETQNLFAQVEHEVRRTIPGDEVELVLQNIGKSPDSFNLAFGDGAMIGTFDGEMSISLNPEHHGSAAAYIRKFREELPKRFPGVTFYFQPADIVTQVLNFGLPAPINIQVAGYDPNNYQIARQMSERLKGVPGAVDVHLHQVVDGPDIRIDVDRTRAAEFGLTHQDVSNNLFVSLASSGQVQPNFWLDPRMGITYLVAAQTPQRDLQSINDLQNTPVYAGRNAAQPQLLSNLANLRRGVTPVNANHTNVQPVFDVYANIQDSDLGSVATDVQKIVKEFTPKLSPGSTIKVRGQVQSMNEAFTRLALGLVFAAIMVYLLMVVNFQSWRDPFIIVTALPGAFVGVVVALFLTQSTFNVPSLMGAIMSIGVATANSILLVTFAKERLDAGETPLQAAIQAGSARLRPIFMTACAMIIGMLPMALGLGEGGEQNAPLARALVGGLTMATVATLFFVPVMFTSLSRNQSVGEAQ